MISVWELTNTTARLALPPGLLILLGLVGLAVMRASPRIGRGLTFFSLIAILLLSLPIVSSSLLRLLEPPYVDPATDKRGGAIVVLGAGSYSGAPEYGHDTVGRVSLERLHYAAYLQRRVRKPVLVSGGNPLRGEWSEAAQMQSALKDFGVAATWVEEGSNNTLENARMSFRLLHAAGIKTVYVVTHAWHMPRARFAFERAGFTVIPAPTGYTTRVRVTLLDFVPGGKALFDSGIFFHEVAGLVWYRLKSAVAH